MWLVRTAGFVFLSERGGVSHTNLIHCHFGDTFVNRTWGTSLLMTANFPFYCYTLILLHASFQLFRLLRFPQPLFHPPLTPCYQGVFLSIFLLFAVSEFQHIVYMHFELPDINKCVVVTFDISLSILALLNRLIFLLLPHPFPSPFCTSQKLNDNHHSLTHTTPPKKKLSYHLLGSRMLRRYTLYNLSRTHAHTLSLVPSLWIICCSLTTFGCYLNLHILESFVCLVKICYTETSFIFSLTSIYTHTLAIYRWMSHVFCLPSSCATVCNPFTITHFTVNNNPHLPLMWRYFLCFVVIVCVHYICTSGMISPEFLGFLVEYVCTVLLLPIPHSTCKPIHIMHWLCIPLLSLCSLYYSNCWEGWVGWYIIS